MEKRLRVIRVHSRIRLWQSEVIWLLKSLRHGCQIMVRHPKQSINTKISLLDGNLLRRRVPVQTYLDN